MSTVALCATLFGATTPAVDEAEPLITGSIGAAAAPVAPLWALGIAAPLSLAVLLSRTGRLAVARFAALAGSGFAALVATGLDLVPAPFGWVLAGAFGGAAAVLALHPTSRPDASRRPVRTDEFVTLHRADGAPVVVRAHPNATFEVPEAATMFERIHLQDRVAFRKALDDAANGGGSGACTYRLMSGTDGAYRTFDLCCRRTEGSAPVVVVASSLDVTGRAIESAGAVDASAAKSRLVAVASHELRTPLNAIVGFCELLRAFDRADAPLPHDRRSEYVALVHDAGTHLLDVVNDLLDMSRIGAGGYALALRDVAAGELIDGCLAMLAPVAERRGVRIAGLADRNLPLFRADRRACRQILINLVSNAIKAAPEGSTVTVSAARAGNALVFRVSDAGSGMEAADIERLCEPFVQVGAQAGSGGAVGAVERGLEGTGLGLSIVKGLVELHGGRLEFRSVPAPHREQGTQVIVTLPIEQGGAADPERVVALPQRTASGPHPRSKEYERVSA